MNKQYECEKCGRLVTIRSKGLCNRCIPKKTYKSSTKIQTRKKSMSDFFTNCKGSIKPISVESGRIIHNFGKQNMCHIFPKRRYLSVSEDELNIVPLLLNEHTVFDELIDKGDIEGLREMFPKTCELIRQRKDYFKQVVTERGRIYNLIMDL